MSRTWGYRNKWSVCFQFQKCTVHDIISVVSEKGERDTSGCLNTACAGPSHDVSWAVSTEQCVMFNEVKALITVEEEKRKYDVTLPDYGVERLLEFDAYVKDFLNLSNILLFGCNAAWLHFAGGFSGIQEKCPLYGLGALDDMAVFRIAMLMLSTLNKHLDALNLLKEAEKPRQELAAEGESLWGTEATVSGKRGAVTLLGQNMSDDQVDC